MEEEKQLDNDFEKIDENSKDLAVKNHEDFWCRFSIIMAQAVPAVISSVVKQTQNTVNFIFLGHLDDIHLVAGVGMGNVCINMLGICIMVGFLGALDTLVSQAYGAKNYQLCGEYLNKARFVTTVAFVPLAISSMYIQTILVSLHQDPQVAYYAQQYIQTYLPGLYLQGLYTCQEKFLNMQGLAQIPMYCISFGMLFHPLWNYLLVTKDQANLGIIGTGIAGVITDSLIFGSLLLYTNRIERLNEANFWPDKRAYTDLGEYLRIGFNSFIMKALSSWAASLVMISTGYLSVREQSSFMILFQFMVVLYQIAVGLDQASNALIGRFIGNGDVYLAQLYYQTFIQVSIVISVFVNIIMYYFRTQIVGVYTSIPEIQLEVLTCIGLLIFHNPPHLMKGMLQGTIKAIGTQYKAKYVNILGQWCLYPTLVYFLAFHHHYGLRGIMFSKICLECFILQGYMFVIITSDWDTIAQQSKQKNDDAFKSQELSDFSEMEDKMNEQITENEQYKAMNEQV